MVIIIFCDANIVSANNAIKTNTSQWKDLEATVVGTWEGDDYTYTFNDDGTGIQQIGEISVSITSYEAKDGKLSITISFLGTEETDEYTYSIKKNVLSLSDGNNTIELNKK